MHLFRAPAAARAARTLDRSLFARTLPTAAASVRDNRFIAKYRKQLEETKELLVLERLSSVAADPDPALAAQGRKCLILHPSIKPAGMQLAVAGLPLDSKPRLMLFSPPLQRLKAGVRFCKRLPRLET